MVRKVSPEVLQGFVEEARGYLPKIFDQLGLALRDPDDRQPLNEAHRLVHNIKGAASMVGLSGLSQLSARTESLLDSILAAQRPVALLEGKTLIRAVSLIGLYLEAAPAGELDDGPWLAQADEAFRALEQEGAQPEHAPAGAIGRTPLPALTQSSSEEAPSKGARPVLSEAAPSGLMEVFEAEAADHLDTITAHLREIASDPGRRDLLREVQRSVHSLKGASSMIGFQTVAGLAHRMEDLLDLAVEGDLELDAARIELLTVATDTLAERLAEPEAESEGGPSQAIEEQLERAAGSLSESDDQPVEPAEDHRQIVSTPKAAPEGTRPSPSPPTRTGSPSIRLPLERLDELVKPTGELVVNRFAADGTRARLESDSEELRLSVERLERSVERLAGHSTGAPGTANLAQQSTSPGSPEAGEFDELEMDRYTEFQLLVRQLAEVASDISVLQASIEASQRELIASAEHEARLTSEIEDRLTSLRMAPLSTLSERLHRTVRTTARQSEKLAELEIEGGDTELDMAVLEGLADPLLHLLRNAVDHGIESPGLRLERGKAEQGRIRLRAFAEGVNVVLRLSDDGAGIDETALHRRAVEGGWIGPEDEEPSREELLALLFAPGFSTAAQVSEVSGRGVGLDVAETTVRTLRGKLAVDSTPLEGTTFTLRIPMTLALTKALMVESGGETFAIPIASVTNTLRVDGSQVEELPERDTLEIDDRSLPAFQLSSLLGLAPAPAADRVPVLTVRFDEGEAAVIVDRIAEAREVVYKSLGSFFEEVPGISGATLSGDGGALLILDPGDLIRASQGRTVPISEKRWAADDADHELEVLIADDSVTVRRLLAGLVQNQGWKTTTARDGQDALEILRAAKRVPDVLLLDLEMPRMSGFELVELLRSEVRFRNVPIIVLTSRGGEKHRRRAAELEVNQYLVKPYQEADLLSAIRRLALPRTIAS